MCDTRVLVCGHGMVDAHAMFEVRGMVDVQTSMVLVFSRLGETRKNCCTSEAGC